MSKSTFVLVFIFWLYALANYNLCLFVWARDYWPENGFLKSVDGFLDTLFLPSNVTANADQIQQSLQDDGTVRQVSSSNIMNGNSTIHGINSSSLLLSGLSSMLGNAVITIAQPKRWTQCRLPQQLFGSLPKELSLNGYSRATDFTIYRFSTGRQIISGPMTGYAVTLGVTFMALCGMLYFFNLNIINAKRISILIIIKISLINNL